MIILLPPPGRQHLGLLQRGEDLAIEQFISEFPVEALDIPVLPRAATLDEERLDAQPGEPGSDSPGHELGPVVRSDVFGDAIPQHQLRQRSEYIP